MNVLLTGCFSYSEEQLKKLKDMHMNIFFMQFENDYLPLSASEIDAVVCNGLFLKHDISAFSRLKFIQVTSAGLDRLPMETIKQRNISVFNARGVYSIPIAEWTVFRVLEHFKAGWFFKEKQQHTSWEKHRRLREVAGCKVAVIGAGNIGQEIGKRFQSLGALTTGFDIHTNPTPGFDFMEFTNTLEQKLSVFDVIILTAPLLPSTKKIISKKILYLLKKNAMLVNISRGGLIDQKALIEVLYKRTDLFAALDVFEEEPLNVESPLWSMENVAISPHNSFVGGGNNDRMFEVIYSNLKSFIEKQRI